MSDQNFTAIESAPTVGRAYALLVRLLGTLTFLKRIIYIPIALSIITVLLPQVFLWLAGEYLKCNANLLCETNIPWLNVSVPVSLGILWFVYFLSFASRVLSWITFEVTGQWSTQSIHKQMVQGLSNVRTTYFDEHPSGRLINRLVRDFENLRAYAVVRMGDAMQSTLEVMSVAVIFFFANPIGFLLIFPILLGFFYIQFHVAAMLQHLGIIRSIRLGNFLHRETDLVEGSRTFLLYGAEKSLLQRLERSVSDYVQAHIVRAKVECWGRFWSLSLTSLYAWLMVVGIAIAVHRNSLSVALASVGITVVFRFTPTCIWLAWSFSFLIESLSTVRRIFEIVDLPKETSEEGVITRLSTQPTLDHEGSDIEFRNFSMSYREDSPIILKDFSVVIPKGSRVGIVGRTGSGKTSLVQSLYRMVYVRRGDITYGKTSLLQADLRSVRNLFAIVPQDPYLFAGTIRSNLDKFSCQSDADLNKALELVGLSFPLHEQVLEGGQNFSFGERQLLCLARALLSKRPIVIMDEPTSGVDTITDARIQQVINTHLKGKTVITIAHRLDTLKTCDLIIRLRDGRVEETGTPEELLQSIDKEEIED